MSEESEELIIAEKAPSTSRPGMLTGLAVAGIVLGVWKLGGLASSLPFVLQSQYGQSNQFQGEPILVEYQELVTQVQTKYILFQMLLLPLTIVVAGLLVWASFKALKLKPRSDVWMKRAVVAAGLLNVAGAVLLVFWQKDNYDVLQTVFANVNEENQSALIMSYVMKGTFYLTIAATVGFLVLELAYYVIAFRYFSKPETRELFQG
ncbi:hypothetical protein [Blastopirellula marina]|uniref:Uncharacterized protein n=1 Tax=Blastopirellula marina TaxID=124 RepID=A0A2S8GFR0_9BACT|nr:hypothetical protein [Blastopirellula marina]PQO42894.1 hypothetical protein C5Y93_24530 [Blastopirellula marina]